MLKHRERFEEWLPASYDGLFDWDFLKPAFGQTKIEPMDFDAVVERRGHVLIFETKGAGALLKQGPILTLTDQWRRGSTVFHIEGKTAREITRYSLYWEGAWKEGRRFGDTPLQPATWLDVLFQTHRWFCRADGRPHPKREEWEQEIWKRDFDAAASGIPGLDENISEKAEA